MTEERKQELRRLLEEARGSLVVRQEYGGRLSLPVDVYRRYLEECWQYFGIDCFYQFWIMPTLDIMSETTKTRLLNWIKEEIAPLNGRDAIFIASYFVENTPTDNPQVYPFNSQSVNFEFILKRLLEITLVRGIEAVVSVFHKCNRPEGVHGFFQDVSIVEGLKLKTGVEVFKGIRLVPLLNTGM